MTTEIYHIDIVCQHYRIEPDFLDEIYQSGIIELQLDDEQSYIHQAQLRRLEQIINLRNDLGINLAGIEVVLNLLERIEGLQLALEEAERRR